jgi:hypothetical protein
MQTLYGLASDFTAGMEVPSECMSNEAISRMGRVSGIRINLVHNTKRKLQMMIISCFSYLRN